MAAAAAFGAIEFARLDHPLSDVPLIEFAINPLIWFTWLSADEKFVGRPNSVKAPITVVGWLRPRKLMMPDIPDVDAVDASGVLNDCSAVGTAAVSCDSIAWVFVAAELPTAWAAAAACPARPPGLAVGVGGVNGVNVEAAAEAPA